MRESFRGIERDLAALEAAAALQATEAFAARAHAQEALEEILDRIGASRSREPRARSLSPLRRRAEALRARLARADGALFARLREAIRRGELRGESLRRELQYLAPPPDGEGPERGGYDALDALVSGVLLDEPPPATVRPELRGWDPDMVPYQPTPARIVFELAARVRPGTEEVVYDLGSGLGQVCVLVHLLSGARAVGVEIDPTLWAYGERLARRLALGGVTFVRGDARDVDLNPGTTFFLYTPFTGAMLQAVLFRLRVVATQHPIRLASYGPCTPAVARQPWLTPEGPAHDDADRLAVFRSR